MVGRVQTRFVAWCWACRQCRALPCQSSRKPQPAGAHQAHRGGGKRGLFLIYGRIHQLTRGNGCCGEFPESAASGRRRGGCGLRGWLWRGRAEVLKVVSSEAPWALICEAGVAL